MMGSTGGALMVLKWIEAGDVGEAGKKLAVAKAAKHPDVNVRTLFEKYLPEDERPQRLGSVIQAAEILELAGDADRGRQVFDQSSASQCKNCHIVRGIGKDLGPDLTQIGKKYERAALLETILEPSKAISHGYETYVAETDDGLIYAGFLVSQNDKQVVLRGADGKQQKIPAKSVESLTKTDKSIMPELVLKDVTAQDAADLLAYLMTLKEPLAPTDASKKK
jgi:putative heme-binding domain-containing protein